MRTPRWSGWRRPGGALLLLAGMVIALRLAGAVSRPPGAPSNSTAPERLRGPVVDTPFPGPTQTQEQGCQPVGVIFPRESVDVSPKAAGRLRAVHVHLGERVSRGKVLASLDTTTLRSELAIARATVRGAAAQEKRAAIEVEQATRKLEHSRILAGERVRAISSEDLARAGADAQLARSALDAARARTAEQRAQVARLRTEVGTAEIQAPFDGVVAARYADAGAFVGAGSPVLRIVRGDELWVRFAVSEDRLDRVAVGRQVDVVVPATGGRASATVQHIAPEVDSAARMFFVEARIDGARRAFQAGLAARVSLDCAAPGR